MKINSFSNYLMYIDSNAHYIPMMGAVIALIGIFEKHIVLPFMHRKTIANSRYFSYISNKPTDVFLLACVPILGSIVIYLSGDNSDYTKDRDSLLKAVAKEAAFLQHADENLRKNADFMSAAIMKNSFAIEYAHLDLKKDEGLMLEAVETDPRVALKYIDPSLKSNPDFMLKAMKTSKYLAMEHIDPSLKSNPDFILEAMKINRYAAIEHVDPSLKSNSDFMLKVLEIDPYVAMEYIDPSLKSNPDFILEAMKILNTNNMMRYRKSSFIDNLKVIIQQAESSLKSNPDFMLKALEIDPYVAMKNADPSLKSNPDFILKVLKINPYVAMKYADPSLKSNPDFVLEAMKIDFRIVKYISEDLKSNDNFMYEVVLQKPQAKTSSVDSIINSIINLDKLYLAPPLMKIPSSMESDIMELSREFNELTKEEISDYRLEREKLAELCRIIQSGPAENTSNLKKLFYKQLSLLLKNIMGQWKSSKGFEYKDKNLRALADAATRCEPTWLEEATRIYSELDGTGTPQAKLLTLVQKYKEATILQIEQADEDNDWHALNRIRKAHGKNLGLNTDLAELDMYINTGRTTIPPTEWNIKALWDAPSLLESIHTALSTQEYDGSLYDFLLEITKKKNYVDKSSCDAEEHELKIKDYIAENFYDEDYKFKLHGVHVMLVDIGVLKAV